MVPEGVTHNGHWNAPMSVPETERLSQERLHSPRSGLDCQDGAGRRAAAQPVCGFARMAVAPPKLVPPSVC